MGLGNVVKLTLRCIPYSLFVKLYPIFKKSRISFLSDFSDEVYYKRFLKESPLINDTDNYINKVKKKNKYCLIKRGVWEYKIANFCFVKDMLSLILWCLDSGYLPIVSCYPHESQEYYKDDVSLWDMFYFQPFTKKNVSNITVTEECPIQVSSIHPSFSDCYNKEMISFWNKIFNRFVKYNNEVSKYIDAEYNKLVKGKKVVACVMRSTDYTKTKPTGHPKQPSIDEVFCKLDSVMDEYGIDYIYLATEDGNIADEFKKKFPGKIIENKRRYFNEIFDNINADRISAVHFDRENDNYLKMIEYMSSIDLVSKCDYLVTGLCGGSQMAIYRNGNTYKYSYIFDKGVY